MSWWSALLRWLAGQPKPPPVTPTRAIGLTVRDTNTRLGVGTARGTLTPILGSVIVGSNDGGRISFYGVGTGVYRLDVTADGYLPATQTFTPSVPDVLPEWLLAPLVPGLVVAGSFFALETGAPFTLIEASSFQAYQKYLDGDLAGLTATLSQLRDLGFNAIRVFGMAWNLFDFNPAIYPTYYARLPAFVQWVAAFGLRTDFCVFPDIALIDPDLAWQQSHWRQIGAALLPVAHCVLLSLQNELDQPPNHMDQTAFAPIAGLICSHGSNGSEALPVSPYWDAYEMHYNNAFEWQRKCGHNTMELGGCGWASENTRPDNDAVVAHFFDAAAGAALLCGGACFHSIPGRTSDPLGGHELDCAQAWVMGALSVPLACQPGAYSHRADLEGPADLRVYQRGSDAACLVHVRK